MLGRCAALFVGVQRTCQSGRLLAVWISWGRVCVFSWAGFRHPFGHADTARSWLQNVLHTWKRVHGIGESLESPQAVSFPQPVQADFLRAVPAPSGARGDAQLHERIFLQETLHAELRRLSSMAKTL